MKVAHILNELRFSGAEIMLAAAANEFLSAGPALVIGTGDQLGQFAPILSRAGYQVAHKPHHRSPSYFASLGRFLREEGVDIVHIHSERSALFYSLMARQYGLASVRTIHNEFNFEGILRFRRVVTRRVARRIGTAHVACSPSVQRNELARYGLKAELINNWMDPDRVPVPSGNTRNAARGVLKLDQNELVALSIANDAPAKNLAALFCGVLEAVKRGVSIRLYHCGVIGPDLQRIADAAPDGCIVALGTVADVKPYLSACDLFLSTSFNEGGQISLLEAAAAGLTCITTEVGIAGAFSGRPATFFIAPNADALANAVILAAQRESTDALKEGRLLASWAREYFVPERGAREYLELYNRQVHGTISGNDGKRRIS
jgi:glycosyltransferase involved in cell wall biosynthesis